MANPFVHVELNTDDVGAARQFYQQLFGWKLSEMPIAQGGMYTLIDVGGGTGGGMMLKPMPEAPNMWLSYVLVDSVKQTIAKAAKIGAQIIVEYAEVPGMGAFGILADPSGAVLGLWEMAMPAKSAEKTPVAKKRSAKAKPKSKAKTKEKTKPAARRAGYSRAGAARRR